MHSALATAVDGLEISIGCGQYHVRFIVDRVLVLTGQTSGHFDSVVNKTQSVSLNVGESFSRPERKNRMSH